MDHLIRDQAIFRVAATLFFVLFFAGTCWWALRGSRDRFRHHSELPLHDGPSATSESAPQPAAGGPDHD